MKKTLIALSVLFSAEFLGLGLFTNGPISWTTPHVPPLLGAASHTDASAPKLDAAANTDGGFVLQSYGELTPRSGGLLTVKENAELFLQRFTVVPLRFRIILAPKVSLYLSKSVLIL